jgi:hypothetical protein
MLRLYMDVHVKAAITLGGEAAGHRWGDGTERWKPAA